MRDFSDRASFYGIEANEKYEREGDSLLVRNLDANGLLSKQAELIDRLRLQVNSLSEKLEPYILREETAAQTLPDSGSQDYDISLSPVSNRVVRSNRELTSLLGVLVYLEERIN